MSLVDDIYEEIETLMGLLTALMVNYPDTRPRMEPAIVKLDTLLINPSDKAIHFVVEDLLDMQVYFRDLLNMTEDKPLHASLHKTNELVNRLLGPH